VEPGPRSVPQQCEKDNDRNGHAKQPKQNSTTHDCFLQFSSTFQANAEAFKTSFSKANLKMQTIRHQVLVLAFPEVTPNLNAASSVPVWDGRHHHPVMPPDRWSIVRGGHDSSRSLVRKPPDGERMGSKAEYEARKAAKRAQRAAEAAAQQPAASEATVIQAADAGSDEDQELRYRATLTAAQAAYQAAGLARLTPLMIMTKTEHPIGEMLLSKIFPDHQDSHCIGFCVTVEPGRIIAQHSREAADTDDGYVSIRIRGAIRLEVGEVVHAALLEWVNPHAQRCLKRVLYPGIILPDGWREVVPTNETHWADEDLDYGEFFGVSVGGLIEGF
jgi:hypothetical protein